MLSTGGCERDSGDMPVPLLTATDEGWISQDAMGELPGFKSGNAGPCSPPETGCRQPWQGGSQGARLDTSLRITGEQTRQGKRIRRHQSRGAMNISCPGLHTARLSPPCTPGGPPRPLITTKGTCRQAGPLRQTPSAAPPDPRHPRLDLYLPRQTVSAPQLTNQFTCIRRWTHCQSP